MSMRKLYRYSAYHEGRWWVLKVADLGLVTQARQLRETDRMAQSIIALHLDVDPESFDVVRDQVIGLPRKTADLVLRAADARLQHEQLTDDLASTTEQAATALVNDGVTLRDAGYLLGLSHQRVAQIVGGAPTQRAGKGSGAGRSRRAKADS